MSSKSFTKLPVQQKPTASRGAKSTLRPFSVYTRSKSFVTNSSTQRNKRLSSVADYSMAPDEYRACGDVPAECPMRTVNTEHLNILQNRKDTDGRKKYLFARWESSPRDKFYYPAATSWRYGWLQPSADK